jgi:hypothetical protein
LQVPRPAHPGSVSNGIEGQSAMGVHGGMCVDDMSRRGRS